MESSGFPGDRHGGDGRNIKALRQRTGYSVRDVQEYFGFEGPQAVYRWQEGKTLPSVDSLYALSALLGVTMKDILVPVKYTVYSNLPRQ